MESTVSSQLLKPTERAAACSAALLTLFLLGCSEKRGKRGIRPPDASSEAVGAPVLPSSVEDKIRSPIAARLSRLLSDPRVAAIAQGHYDAACEPTDLVRRVYVGELQLDVPVAELESAKSLRGRLASIGMRNGWNIVVLPPHRSDYVVTTLREEIVKKVAVPQGAAVEGLREIVTDLTRRFRFSSDYDLHRVIWTRDFADVEVERLALNSLIENWCLAEIKSLCAPVGTTEGIAEVAGGHLAGFLFGDLDSMNPIVFEGFDERYHVSLMFSPRRGEAGARLPRQVVARCVSSLRPVSSKHPALDMLATAEELLSSADQREREAAIVFIHSAAQYATGSTKTRVDGIRKRLERQTRAPAQRAP